jgi:hypothetical protein
VFLEVVLAMATFRGSASVLLGKLRMLEGESISSGRAKVTDVTAAVCCAIRSSQAPERGNSQ